ncbi:MAG: MBL fold metallo-hydrolase [Bacteroidales bacterium]|nr:MBL fold metallo-hydrolase [Bacteroidales bacterium]
MPKNKNHILFLGTGTSTGVPVLSCHCEICRSEDPKDSRLRTSAYIEMNGMRIIIDIGPDFRQQLLRADIDDFDAILITHGHRDHIAGLDEVRAFNYIRNKRIKIYTRQDVANAIRTEFPYIFDPKGYKGPPQIDLHIINKEKFMVGNLEIQPIEVIHGEVPISGFRIGNLCYITDASHIPDESFPLLENCEILVLNALRTRPHPTHFSLDEALEVVEKVQPKKCYFTHISHFMGFQNIVNTELPEGIQLAHDMLKVEF